MKDLSIYFRALQDLEEYTENQLGSKVVIHSEGNFPDLVKNKLGVALIYVPEYRGDRSEFQFHESDSFRKELYRLNIGVSWELQIFDLGTILPGESKEDTFFALSQVVGELVKNKIIPIVIGGSQDLTLSLYKGYQQLEQMVNLCCIDSKLDLGSPEEPMHSGAFLSHLLLQRPCYLFNHANVGLQAPYAAAGEIELFEKLYFDSCRLGEFNSDRRKAEPHLRNADILSLDLSAIRAGEINSPFYQKPNGFFADQICQIGKYAGISDKLTSFGIFNYYPDNKQGLISVIVAEIIWYFIDGVVHRKGDFPSGSKRDYLKFNVKLDDFKDTIIFYKSNKSDRWWMEVPYPPSKGVKYERHHLVPCDATDYERAMKNELPDLWWKTYQKLS
jgi:formiminoglutamase